MIPLSLAGFALSCRRVCYAKVSARVRAAVSRRGAEPNSLSAPELSRSPTVRPELRLRDGTRKPQPLRSSRQPSSVPCSTPCPSSSRLPGPASRSVPGPGSDGPDGDHSCRGGSRFSGGPRCGQRPHRSLQQHLRDGQDNRPGAPPARSGPARPVSL